MTETMLTRSLLGPSIVEIGEDQTQIFVENGLGFAAINTYGLENAESVNEFCRFLGFNHSPRPNEYVSNRNTVLAWVRPGKWLVIGMESQVIEIAEHAKDFVGAIVLVTPLSNGRQSLCLFGIGVMDVLLSLSEFDLQSLDIDVKVAISTRFDEMHAFIQRLDDKNSWRIIVDRSDADHAIKLLVESLKNVGSRM
jgi:heterotetrameric sarcosine oxidase gamma subunit